MKKSLPLSDKIEKKHTAIKENEINNESLTTELHFDLFKQYAWLSSAAIGVIIVLVQMKAIELGADIYSAIAFLAFSIITSLYGNDFIVDNLLKGKGIYEINKKLKLLRLITLFCSGLGFGLFLGDFIW